MDPREEAAHITTDGPLTLGECLRLLRSVPIGQLVYTEDALPAVRPVTFAAPDGEIVIPTGGNPWFERFEGIVVAFEAGSFASLTRSGWTVLAIGQSRLVSGTVGLDGFDDPAYAPWTVASTDYYLVIDIASLQGQRTTLLRPEGDQR
ncbi:pyridoxamine 5'-phosphate oxidase family protein [Rhodococcus sp. NPDC056960]|uniref:pyridoxamine 5'-phosphate oxidase family protein n=1 Tax=Rhodococcus sp. NPDC056960 TaxID=3345982 RepID=UPI00363D2089